MGQNLSLGFLAGKARCTALLGASGSGKSQLLMSLSGVSGENRLSAGSVGRVSLVIQNPESALFCDTVRDEIEFVQRINGVVPDPDEAQKWLGLLGLSSSLLGASPDHLSGGEKRRLAIACAIAARPEVLLLDEPSAGLDPSSQEMLHQVLEGFIKAPVGPSLVIATHDAEEALRLSTHALVLRSGEIAWHGETQELLSDAHACESLRVPMLPQVFVAARVGKDVGLRPPKTVDCGVLEDWVVTISSQNKVSADSEAGEESPVNHASVSKSFWVSPTQNTLPPMFAALSLIVATYSANYMVVSVGAFAVALAWALLRGEKRSTALILKPTLLLAIAMVFLQIFFGGRPEVGVAPGYSIESGMALSAWRVIQAASMMLSVVAVTSTISAMEMASAIGRFLPAFGSVRLRRLTQEFGFIMGMAIGMMPMVLEDIDRLRTSIRARGVDASKLSVVSRLKLIPAVVAPLMVGALQRSNTLGEAIHVRGYIPGVKPTRWRATRIDPGDIGVLAFALVLLVVSLVIR